MRSTFKTLFYIDKRRVKTDNTTAIMCRITIDGKISTFSTTLYCSIDDWSVKSSETNSVATNQSLSKLRKQIEENYNTLLKNNGVVSAELLKNSVVCDNSAPQTLLAAGEMEREVLRLRSIEINSTSSYRQSKTSQKNLTQFLNSRGEEDIKFSDITYEFGESYKLFLKKDLGHKASHINNCLVWLNRLIYLAVDRDIIRCNPIADMKYEKKQEPKLTHISREELQRIMARPSSHAVQEMVRRVFIFSCFTALSYADVYNLQTHNIGTTAEGRTYIRIKRVKTTVEAFIPLHPVAEKILKLYNTTDPTQPVFPLPVRDMIWHDLQEIAFISQIPNRLSYHQARHSFGTFALSAGVPIESISKMMGHTNIRSTQVYAKVTNDKISADMDRLMERRKQNSLKN
ncbi:MAG: site-specific integrase [Rikenellaceae bacterium]